MEESHARMDTTGIWEDDEEDGAEDHREENRGVVKLG